MVKQGSRNSTAKERRAEWPTRPSGAVRTAWSSLVIMRGGQPSRVVRLGDQNSKTEQSGPLGGQYCYSRKRRNLCQVIHLGTWKFKLRICTDMYGYLYISVHIRHIRTKRGVQDILHGYAGQNGYVRIRTDIRTDISTGYPYRYPYRYPYGYLFVSMRLSKWISAQKSTRISFHIQFWSYISV